MKLMPAITKSDGVLVAYLQQWPKKPMEINKICLVHRNFILNDDPFKMIVNDSVFPKIGIAWDTMKTFNTLSCFSLQTKGFLG